MSFTNDTNPRLTVRKLVEQASDPDLAAVEWARSVANDAGLAPDADSVRVIRELRRADTALDLKTATYIWQQLVAAEKSSASVQ